MAEQQMTFSIDDLAKNTGWAKGSAEIYISKKFSGVIKKTGARYKVDKRILNVSYDRYASLFKQKRKLFVEYSKYDHPDVTIYEFFLPLTLEHVLRQALDELFYKDTVMSRLELIGIDKFAELFNKKRGEKDNEFLKRVCEFASRKFGGYSINHVKGRFRANDLLTKRDVAENEKIGKSYIIDETTAIAKFIIPYEATKGYTKESQPELPFEAMDIEQEYKRTEWLFQNLFVDAVLQATTDQDEIWLLESGKKYRLHRYKAQDREE
jgi:hypothetical protein